MSDNFEEYRPLSRKTGAMGLQIAKKAKKIGLRQAVDHVSKRGGIRNAIRQKLGLKPKERKGRENPEYNKKTDKMIHQVAKMAAVLDTHKPGVEQFKSARNKDRGAHKYSRNKISPFKRNMSDKQKEYKEEIMMALLDNLFEREYKWREKLPSGKTPSEKSNRKLADLSRQIADTVKKNKSLDPRTIQRAKKLRDASNIQNTISPASERKGPSSRGGKAQKPKDTNSLEGSLPNIVAAKRTATTKDGKKVTVGGEGEANITTGRHGNSGRGTTGGSGGTIRNQAKSYSTTTHHGVKGNQYNNYKPEGNLIEWNRKAQRSSKAGNTPKSGPKSKTNDGPKGIVTVGLPASGKSSMAKHMVSKGNTDQHELDKSRKALGKGPAYFGKDIVQHSNEGQRESRKKGRNSVVSNTSIPKAHRQQAERNLKDAGYKNVTSVLAPGSTKAAMRRNRNRPEGAKPGEGKVPQFVMNRMSNNLKSLKRSDKKELRKNFKKLHKQERFTKPAMKRSRAINSDYDPMLTEKTVKARGDRRRKEGPSTPAKYKYWDGDIAPGKDLSPGARKRREVKATARGGSNYNESVERFRSRIEEAMSPRFSRTTPQKAAARLRAVRKDLEQSFTQQSKPEVNAPTRKKRKLEFEVR